MDGSIRVLIADDHAIVRKGIRALLATEPDIEVVGEAANGQEAIAETQRLRPDVVLMDLLMPELDGIDAIRHINQRQPETRILVLTSFVSNGKVFGAVEAGALGYLLKDAGPEELAKSIRQVYRWEPSFQPAVARKLLQTISGSPPSGAPIDPPPHCRFFDRCPYADGFCRDHDHPPLEDKGGGHLVACYKV